MKYHIKIWGRGGKFGIGSITQEQYEFWTDEENEEFLADELRQFLDDDDLVVPPEARFEEHFTEYAEICNQSGVETEFMSISITSEKDEVIFSGSYSDFLDEFGPTVTKEENTVPDEDENDGVEEHFLFWMMREEGVFFSSTFETDKLDLKKFKFNEVDIYGSEVIIVNKVSYGAHDFEQDSDELDSVEEEFILL